MHTHTVSQAALGDFLSCVNVFSSLTIFSPCASTAFLSDLLTLLLRWLRVVYIEECPCLLAGISTGLL